MDKSQALTPDQVGLTILQNLNTAELFNNWMFETIKPHVKGKVLEIGSGIGNISEFFIRSGIPLHMSDLRPDYCQALRNKFLDDPCSGAVHNLDLATPSFETEYAHLLGSYDTVFALNVIEHIADDRLALANCYKLLAPEGRVIILVPAYSALYNVLDRELEHYRRYTRHSLSRLLGKYFNLVHTQYFNLAGIVGWFCAGTIGRKKIIPEGPLTIYNRLVPLFKILDRIAFNRVGLSVIAVGEKK